MKAKELGLLSNLSKIKDPFGLGAFAARCRIYNRRAVRNRIQSNERR